jgi:hypothetical protein
MGWFGLTNGKILAEAARQFDVVLTADQNIEFHQNLENLPIAVIVLAASSNRIESLQPLVPLVLDTLSVIRARQFVRLAG